MQFCQKIYNRYKSANKSMIELEGIPSAVARALIGGGGIFIYSCYARRISFEISCF